MRMQGTTNNELSDIISMVALWVVYFLSSLLYSYSHYAVACYIRDVYWGETNDSIFSYLIPRKTFLGALGIGILTTCAFIPIGIVGLIGLLLFVVPGVVVFSYSGIATGLMYTAYLGHPEEGVMSTIPECLGLLRGNLWRTVALGTISWLVYLLMSSPMGVFNFLINFMASQSPSFADSLLFPISYAGIFVVISWFAVAFGFSGTLHILNRYYFDLKSRQQPLASVTRLNPDAGDAHDHIRHG
jgi:hypothetical protein